MLATDTLRCDTTLIQTWQTDEAYNYQRELVGQRPHLGEMLMSRIDEWLGYIFGSQTAAYITRPLLILIGLALILTVLWFVYRTRPELFGRRRKTPLDYEVAEETIYGIDFDHEISTAVGRHDWRQAVRYAYLQTLRTLADRQLIDWQPHKTPTQYVYEYRSDEFRQLTHHFLLVRYGRHEATEELFGAVRLLARAVVEKGGEA